MYLINLLLNFGPNNFKIAQGAEGSQGQTSWIVALKSTADQKERKITAYSIWLQGTVHTIINPSTLILKDNSGLVKVTNCDKIAGGSNWIQRGLYCSVIGELVSSNRTPCIQASKMTSLDSNPNLELLWAWEIQDLANFLTQNDPEIEDDFDEYNF